MEASQKKILIIDDDSRNIFALKAVLTAKKFTCLAANGAHEGFEIIKKNDDVGVVLLDMMMPDLDGYQAMAKMKEDEQLKDVPVIAVTAQAMLGDKERCLEAGAVGYVSKPVNVEELVKLLNNYL
ncbi:response regulator [Pedobacter xixiisoli]|uniref:Response regulator receiver domain-containing protein n=1 Tax=Pedobacter xixiisoli TaxID=1476464 RepID=A0A286ADN5_9SPHI|nr:response regulator [Pedobacter xixiisoli]SOD20016.1 Response regulator receiver domain-containing protein [Pedobacter xixiisoli]